MDNKHTPGPWSIIPAREYDGDDDDFVGAYTSPASIEGADGNPVCVFGTCEGSGELFENEADYTLIAAAPDMLEALYSAVESIEQLVRLNRIPANNKGLRDARAAIAKAEGRADA